MKLTKEQHSYMINPKKTYSEHSQTLGEFYTAQKAYSSRKVSVDGVVYNSMTDAIAATCVIEVEIRFRCKSDKFPAWQFIE